MSLLTKYPSCLSNLYSGWHFHTWALVSEEEGVQKYRIIQRFLTVVLRTDWKYGFCFPCASVADVFILFLTYRSVGNVWCCYNDQQGALTTNRHHFESDKWQNDVKSLYLSASVAVFPTAVVVEQCHCVEILHKEQVMLNNEQSSECSFEPLFIVIQVSFQFIYWQYTIPILGFVQRGITSTQTPEYMLALHRYVVNYLF